MRRQHIVIVGGGMTGLAAAWWLHKAYQAGMPIRYTLLEASARLGGKIKSEFHEGFLIEHGPDSFLTTKPDFLDLVREVGLEEEIIAPRTSRYYLVRRGRLIPAPDGLFLGVPTRLGPFLRSPLISWRGKARMVLDLFIPPRSGAEDESVATFIERRLGREALEWLAGPLMAGIHSADPAHLSLLATFPHLRLLERQHGSLIRALWMRRRRGARRAEKGRTPFLTLRRGMQSLVEALQARLHAEWVHLEAPLRALTRVGAGYRLRLDDGTTLDADALILTTPSAVSATLIDKVAPDAAAHLRQLRALSSASIALGYRLVDVPHLPEGSGCLVPRPEGYAISGMTFASRKFPNRAPDGSLLLRLFVGGAGREEIVTQDDETLLGIVRRELQTLLGIHAEPTLVRIQRWVKARPQYDVGHLERVAAIEAALPSNLLVVGSAMRGAGLPDCARQGRDAAERVLADLRNAGEEAHAGDLVIR